MRQYDQAVEQCQKTLEMDPNFPLAHLYQGLAYEQKSMYQEAITEFHQAITAPTSSTQAIASLGHAYAVSGMRDEAQNVIIDLNELSRQHYVSPYDFAVIYAGLGEKGESFGWIERAYRERALWLVFLKVDPRFDGLRSDPRFTDLLRRVGLA
jgi:tetratricopeptide (TPR) repeat protein